MELWLFLFSSMWILNLSNAFRAPGVSHRVLVSSRVARCFSTSPAATSSSSLATVQQEEHGEVQQQNSNTVQEQRQDTNNDVPSRHRGPNIWKQQTGGLRRLPVIDPPLELRNRAKRGFWYDIKADKNVKNSKKRAIKHGCETFFDLQNKLCLPMRQMVKSYRAVLRNLHPFEQIVAELTISNVQQKDGLDLETVLLEVHEARKMILLACQEWIAKVKMAVHARDANTIRKEGFESILELFDEVAHAPMMNLVHLQKALRKSPIVKLDTPTMVLVGYPNVGKSSIVRKLTTAAPEVNNYPFTTRGLTIGHFDIAWNGQYNVAWDGSVAVPYDTKIHAYKHRCQIMDSPGVLNREQRNKMEQLTIAAMQHLPTAVCFVVDLTNWETVPDQLEVRRQIRERFPKRPWCDVATKADLFWEPKHEAAWREMCDHKGIAVSVEEDYGVEELRTTMADCLGQVELVLTAMEALKNDPNRALS